MIIKYWLKIIVCNEAKYIRYIYNMMLEDMDSMPDKDNWASLVKKLLESLGFNDVWLAQGVGNVNLFLSLVKQRLHDQFIQNWNSRIQESSRANFYACVSSFQFRNYLNFVKVKKYRNALTRLICSSHRLEIESGRWHKPVKIPTHQRLCKRCNVIENEFHFLFECSLYNDLRKQYIDIYFYTNPNHLKLKQMFNTTNEKQIIDIAIFVQKAFTLRNTLCY